MFQQLLKLPEALLLKVIYYLNLQELQQLGQTSHHFHELVYNNPRVWHQHVLFPPKDSRITDRFVKQLVPQITRHYGIRTLRLIQLPLTWQGYLFIFDQFAHSVDHIQLETTLPVLQDLVHHLTIFAANLTMLQQDNHIPITFRQYCNEDQLYYQTLKDCQFLGESDVEHITRLFLTNNKDNIGNREDDSGTMQSGSSRLSNLDDPPFERLLQWQVRCTDHLASPDSKDGSEEENCMKLLESIVTFLAGRPLSNTSLSPSSPAATTNTTASTLLTTLSSSSPTVTSNSTHIMTGQKRTQDQLDPSNRQRQRLVSPPRASSLYV